MGKRREMKDAAAKAEAAAREAAAEKDVWENGSNMAQITPDRGSASPEPVNLVEAAPRPLSAGQGEQIAQELHWLRSAAGRLSKRLKVVEEHQLSHAHPIVSGRVREGSPPWRNGMHIDSQGRYWMRKPDGWHAVHVMVQLAGLGPIHPVQRLAEPKG